jgi:hypothetical protein
MIKTLRSWLVGVALIGALGALSAQASDAVYPTGSRVGLAPPSGLAKSDRFVGFEDASTGTSVRILEVPAEAYSEIAKQMSKDALKTQGVLEETRETLAYTGGKGALIAGRLEGDRKGRKYILLANGPDAAALIVVEVPDDAKDAYPDSAIRTMLSSFAVRPSVPIDEQLRLLPLRFDEMSGMRPVRVMGTSGVILTNGPKDTLDPSEQAVLVISVGRGGPEDASGRDAFARTLFAGAGGFKDLRIVGAEMLRLGGGLQTHQLFAEARDPKTEAPMKLVQWIRFGSGAFLRIVGAARADDWSDAFPRFRAVRDGVNPRS